MWMGWDGIGWDWIGIENRRWLSGVCEGKGNCPNLGLFC